ncbi:MAG: TetR/AcrR family transcriptional regulator [bacterium]
MFGYDGGRGSGGSGKGGGSGGGGKGGGSGRGRGQDGKGLGRGIGRFAGGEHPKRHRGLTEFGWRWHEHGLSRAEQGERTREDILTAATSLFSEKGFAGTSMRMLAHAIGASQALLHFHFGSKMGLYRAVLDKMKGGREETLEMPSQEDTDFEDSFLDGLSARLRYYQKNPARAKIVLWSALEDMDEESPDMVRVREKIIEWLQRAESEGLIREEISLPHLAAMLAGIILLWPLIRERYTEMLQREERKNTDMLYNDLILEIFMRGVGTKALEQDEKKRRLKES